MRKFMILLVTLLLLFTIVGSPMIASADGPDGDGNNPTPDPIAPVTDSVSHIVNYVTNFIFCGASCW